MFNCAMRQVEERHVTYQVDLMVWSNRLDLVAISNFKGKSKTNYKQNHKMFVKFSIFDIHI